MTRQDLARELEISPSTFRNFLNGTSNLTPIVYRALEEFFRMSKEEKRPVVKKNKMIIQPWMIRNLKTFGNTVVCNITKRRTPESVENEFAKLGIPVTVDENGIAWMNKGVN